jgi:hypothetical protein
MLMLVCVVIDVAIHNKRLLAAAVVVLRSKVVLMKRTASSWSVSFLWRKKLSFFQKII